MVKIFENMMIMYIDFEQVVSSIQHTGHTFEIQCEWQKREHARRYCSFLVKLKEIIVLICYLQSLSFKLSVH